MKSPVTTTRGLRRAGIASVFALASLTLAACASDTDAGAEAPSETAEATTSAESTASAESSLADVMKAQDAYEIPSEPIDASSLAGTTVYYIPVTAQAPQFAAMGVEVTAALGTVGIDVQVCDGQGNPSAIAKCFTQAVNADADAILADAIAYGFAMNSVEEARSAGVPVIIGNQVADPSITLDDTLGWIEGPSSGMTADMLTWAAEDSGGEAHILINMSTDGTTPKAYVDTATEALAESCPACVVTINGVTTASFDLVASSTSAALLKDPSIDYVFPQFEQFLQVTAGGVQSAGRDDVTLMTGSAQIGALQELETGGQLRAVQGVASFYQAWVYSDAAMRMALGMELPEYTIPYRIFTADTMDDVQVTEEAQASGEWYGPTTFKDDFKALWGAQ
ncbi:hypothetical protein QQX09_10645 [Demequina sp. SYSU T00192]|uniref:Monosaccharide ABC transporter substrate-binding protein, CUT2 family n=1 Tax=Demequina litoralis TaxID=3051660 RepID=A0ABT8GB05_9MICO|nr:hypothetical protein [Demequina sp. SYSU T00192]MDN4476313.1 hypothetical protein [Demequina sp. SYSU T00192]